MKILTYIHRLSVSTFLLLVLGTTDDLCSAKNYFGRPSLGISVGSWKPIDLDRSTSVSILPVRRTSPFCELFFISPWLKNLAIRFGMGYWQQTDLPEQAEVQSVLIIPLSIDIKYQMLPQTRLSPYASYGVTFYYGTENPKTNFPRRIAETAELALGFNVGAGLDYSISRRWAIGSEFQYLYVRMPHLVGQTDNYSGPKITVRIFYLF